MLKYLAKLVLLGFTICSLPLNAQEICGNGIDDNGDGYIDCYATECTEEDDCFEHFWEQSVGCEEPPPFIFGVTLGWVSPPSIMVNDLNQVVAADIDNDGNIELFVAGINNSFVSGTPNTNLYILNGNNGALKTVINFEDKWDGQTMPAIGDVDNDGKGEIIISSRLQFDSHSRLYVFEHTGVLKYAVNVPNFATNRTNDWALADFDQNGTSEIYTRGIIIDGASGNILITIPETVTLTSPILPYRCSVAVDILPTAFCANCDGLELVIGNSVYALNLTTGTATLQVSAASFGVGFTSIADWDLDGDLDVLVYDGEFGTNFNGLYVWDGQTPTILGSFASPDGRIGSRVCIGNVDNDPFPEAIYKTVEYIYAVDNDFTLKWSMPIQENGTGMTPATVFDFDGNGIMEVVHRDENSLKIYTGTSGMLLGEISCYSITGYEVVIIVDADNNGQAEIITTCNDNPSNISTSNSGRVKMFHSSASPWMPTRRVWNQQGYFNVNINDNLSVPIQQQHHHLPFPPGSNYYLLNTFMAQYSPLLNTATADTIADALLTLHTACANGAVHFEICNQGNAFLPAASPVAFYDNNPTLTGAALIDIWFTTVALPPGACQVFTHTLPPSSGSIFLVVNDYGLLPPPFNPDDLTTPAGINECEMNNNLTGMQWAAMPYLNPIISCQNGSIVAQIEVADTESQSSFSWSSGQTTGSISVTENDIYCVTITNLAGSVCTYSLCQTIDLPTVASVSIAGNAQLPPNSSTVLSVTPNFAQYLWSTGQTEPAITISQSGTYTVTVTDDWGCTASGSLLVEQLSENIDDPINDTIPPLKFLIPNAFSPNNDGVNDHFAVLTWGGTVTDYALFVYNRWGNLVFESHQLQNTWDGRFKNTHAPIGTYAYYGYIVFSNGQSHWFQGNVTLIR